MAVIQLNTNGLRCPQPVLKIAARVPELKTGDILEVLADCPTFPKDVQMWCERSRKTLIFCRAEGAGKFNAHIQF